MHFHIFHIMCHGPGGASGSRAGAELPCREQSPARDRYHDTGRSLCWDEPRCNSPTGTLQSTRATLLESFLIDILICFRQLDGFFSDADDFLCSDQL